jgi:DNA mismatch endonuclease (patch repair protein)
MADVFSRQKRSMVMSRVRSRGNLVTELRLAQIFRDNGIKGWRRHLRIAGTPDFVFPSVRLVVFVDGCFWHGCPQHGSIPSANRAFWKRKLQRNKERDRKVGKDLRRAGWQVVRIWQHELAKPARIARKVKLSLECGRPGS